MLLAHHTTVKLPFKRGTVCRKGTSGLWLSPSVDATKKKPRHALIKVGFLAAGIFMVVFAVMWFSLVFAPLLVARNDGLRPTAQSRSRTVSTNSFGELLSDGRTFLSAFRYVMQSEPTGIPGIIVPETNLALMQTGFAAPNPAATLSNAPSWRASKDRTNADG